MIGFEPNDEQQMIAREIATFARTTLRERYRSYEEARALPDDARRIAHELGAGVAGLPEAVGGAGLGMIAAVLGDEELAWGDPAAAFAVGGPGAFGLALAELATPERAQAELADLVGEGGSSKFAAVAWSEPRGGESGLLQTTATRTDKGYRLDGTKTHVLNAELADRVLVLAQLDASAGADGIAAFVVRKGARGLTARPRVRTLGLDAASFGGFALEGVEVDESARVGGEGMGMKLVRFFAKYALVVAARQVGLARAAFETAHEYVQTRKAFGKPIGHFQSVAFTVADRAMDVDASRAMVWRAAWAWDSGASELDALKLTGWAVSQAHEAAMRCANDAVQLHGGAGFMRDYPVEKWMRDAKQMQVCALSAEQADQLAAGAELGRVSPELVLPSASGQPTFT